MCGDSILDRSNIYSWKNEAWFQEHDAFFAEPAYLYLRPCYLRFCFGKCREFRTVLLRNENKFIKNAGPKLFIIVSCFLEIKLTQYSKIGPSKSFLAPCSIFLQYPGEFPVLVWALTLSYSFPLSILCNLYPPSSIIYTDLLCNLLSCSEALSSEVCPLIHIKFKISPNSCLTTFSLLDLWVCSFSRRLNIFSLWSLLGFFLYSLV